MVITGTSASLPALRVASYQALRHGAAVVERSDRTVLRVAGADRLSWLQGLLTNDLLTLATGDARYAAWLTPQGRMITDARVIASSEAVLLDVPRTLAASLQARLDGLIFAEDALVADESDKLIILEVLGPDAGEVTAQARGSWPDAVIAHDRTPAFEARVVIADTDDAVVIVAALAKAGARQVSLGDWNVARIEAGVPLFGVDMDETTIPLEAGIETRAISFSKGCYVGQEVIVRVMQRGGGRVARRLVGLHVETGQPLAGGDVVRAGEREIGRVTSAVISPALNAILALAYLHRDFVMPGTPVVVSSAGCHSDARVVHLPISSSSMSIA